MRTRNTIARSILILPVFSVLFSVFCLTHLSLAEQPLVEDITVKGDWKHVDPAPIPLPGQEDPGEVSLEKILSRTWFVQSGPLPETTDRVSFGGALNLKFYSGISYDYLQKELPGKKISLKVNVPREALSSSMVIPNRLRVSLKAEKDGEWTDIFADNKEWVNVRKPGLHDFTVNVPPEPVKVSSGELFHPENAILLSVDYFLMEGSKNTTDCGFSLSGFEIEGLNIDPSDLAWQFTNNGYAVQEQYLPGFVEGSTFMSSIDRRADLIFAPLFTPEPRVFSGELEDMFLVLAVYIPRELRHQKGTLALTLKHNSGKVRSSVKNFDSCNLEGYVFLTLPLDEFPVKENIEEVITGSSLSLRISTSSPHEPSMAPFVLTPLRIRQGRLIPFDSSWRVRDIQGRGGYTGMEIRPDGTIGESNFAVKALGKDLYQLDAIIHMKGGIDWENPFYKVELIRDFPAPLDLDNMRIEVLMDPVTDTMKIWQRPFRARVGVEDTGGSIMFGPNISLSEGLPGTATLDVSTNNPMPKGLVTPGFDPGKIRSLVINIEGSHGPTEPIDLKLSLLNLAVRPREYERTSPVKNIDFSRFTVAPDSWALTDLVKEAGGYLVGINYPFPVLPVSAEILRVPQIYPCVGMKANDPMHLGFGSPLTKKTVVEDFKKFVEKDINVVRLLVLGHLEGVYTFDEKGRDIAHFGKGQETLVQETAGMSVERFAEFLNENEDSYFLTDRHGDLLGLQKQVLPDLIAFLDILEQVEKETGKRLMAILAFYDFLLGDGSSREGPLRQYIVGNHPEVVTDPVVKIKAQALLWKMVKELSRDERFHRYIAIAEIMNEPANATILSTRERFTDLLNFVGEGLYLLKDAVGPSMPVSVGFRSWPGDLRYWSPIAEGVDVLMVHYWESLESYNIDVPGLWPLEQPASELWEHLGAEPGGRLTGMGEIGPLGNFKNNLFRLEKAGYDFSLVWSYSGHDSYNAKPFMDDIKEYQESNYMFNSLKHIDRETVKKAFIYLLTARDLFDTSYEDLARPAGADISKRDFNTYAHERAGNISDPGLRNAVLLILRMGELKNADLDRHALKLFLFRAI